MAKILFSSVCKPIGPSVGDTTSVGYELLHGQVTRAQHIYSPRVVHKQFALDYISINLDTPSKVLHYPSKRTFIKEIKKGYDIIGISFVLSTAHHMIEMCKLIRQYSPSTKIVLGGYGTVMSDEELQPYSDAICRGEGVEFMRRFLGEPPIQVEEYHHPDIKSRLRVFGIPVSHTAMVFAGLGCPNGCDFCCTSHYFKKQHIKLLSSGSVIFDVISKHKRDDPNMDHTILDEDFLLNKQRAFDFLNCCRKENTTFSIFCFASVKALSQYTFDELIEMGIDGLWVGYEGKQSGYEKHEGVNIDQLIRDLEDHGIAVLTSMIVGIPYQTDEITRQEFSDLMSNEPSMCQFLIYGPTPGTPFYEKVMEADLLHNDLSSNNMRYYKKCTGFTAMVKHPFLRRKEIEKLQKEFYKKSFEMLGPSILRLIQVKLNGWNRYKDHKNPLLCKKADEFKKKLSPYLSILPVAIIGPKITIKNRIKYIRQFFKILKISPWRGKIYVFLSPVMAIGAFLTWLNLFFKFFEHPFTRVHRYNGRRLQEKHLKHLCVEYQLPLNAGVLLKVLDLLKSWKAM
ncbi:MAG: B12-binding domain-containing radical SAM protein [Thermodesulfobacteriota bacterium]